MTETFAHDGRPKQPAATGQAPGARRRAGCSARRWCASTSSRFRASSAIPAGTCRPARNMRTKPSPGMGCGPAAGWGCSVSMRCGPWGTHGIDRVPETLEATIPLVHAMAVLAAREASLSAGSVVRFQHLRMSNSFTSGSWQACEASAPLPASRVSTREESSRRRNRLPIAGSARRLPARWKPTTGLPSSATSPWWASARSARRRRRRHIHRASGPQCSSTNATSATVDDATKSPTTS